MQVPDDLQGDPPPYYGIIPAPVRLDNDLDAMARLIYGEVLQMASREGDEFTQAEIAERFGITTVDVDRHIHALAKHGHLKVGASAEFDYFLIPLVR